MTKLAPPTLLTIQVPPKRRKAKKPFEIAHRSGRESQVKGTEGSARLMTSSGEEELRAPYGDLERSFWEVEDELDAVATRGGRRMDVASDTTECQSIACVPARVAAARISSLADARSVAPLVAWLLT
jgi:hypothetical protein